MTAWPEAVAAAITTATAKATSTASFTGGIAACLRLEGKLCGARRVPHRGHDCGYGKARSVARRRTRARCDQIAAPRRRYPARSTAGAWHRSRARLLGKPGV